MRYLISALCAVAILLAAPADTAVASSAECGRVTAYVICVEFVGTLTLTRSDLSETTVSVPAGTSSGGLSGYVCIGVERDALTGLLQPGMAGYVPERAAVLGASAGPASLPVTSTSPSGDRMVPILGALGAALLAFVGLLGPRPARTARPVG